jgi:hypothetical protein
MMTGEQGTIRGGRLVGRLRPDGEGCGDQRGEQSEEEEFAEPEAELSHGRGLDGRDGNGRFLQTGIAEVGGAYPTIVVAIPSTRSNRDQLPCRELTPVSCSIATHTRSSPSARSTISLTKSVGIVRAC